MSKHLFGLVVTAYGPAANNRGDSEGSNITPLQKILWNGEVHTTVSAEAIRWAIRYYWQRVGHPVNRFWDDEENDHVWKDEKHAAWKTDGAEGTYIDDDVLGFMTTDGPTKLADARRGVLEVTRAVSLTPFTGDITFNARSGMKGKTSLYGTEVHATCYQYGVALTPESLRLPERSLYVVDAIVSLANVAGNHGRFLYDFSPDSVVFRWTDDPAPRILYGFEMDDSGAVSMRKVIERVASGDVPASELVVGGSVIASLEQQELEILRGATLVPGVRAAAVEIQNRMRADLNIEEVAS